MGSNPFSSPSAPWGRRAGGLMQKHEGNKQEIATMLDLIQLLAILLVNAVSPPSGLSLMLSKVGAPFNQAVLFD
ncbi:hypothetical protein D5086_002411 [Populus alba]|uniref:Uncharacterized protein n=1 Tax=Populus alba TaxID=43335 RepID=A0ACC4D3R8_POPAL